MARKYPKNPMLMPAEPEEMSWGEWVARGSGVAVSAGQKRMPYGGGYRPNAEAPKTRSPRAIHTPHMNPFKVRGAKK